MKFSLPILLVLALVAQSNYSANAFMAGPKQSRTVIGSTFHRSDIICPTHLASTTESSQESQSVSYAAAGSPVVDMNRYNLPLSNILEEWTAVIQPETSMQDGGIFLKSKNDRDLFVDTLRYTIKRDGGLGLVLTEIAGGRGDGVGITVIEEILEGSNAEGSGILPGDSIVALTVFQPTDSSSSLNVQEQRTDVSTECRGYDSTIDALLSLPEVSSPSEEITITIKRIRRQPKVNVKLQYPPETNEPDVNIELFAGENLRRAMLTRGVNLNDALSRRFDSGGTGDCGAEGTCATCAIAVTKGADLLSPAKIQEQQIFADKPRWRMACKAIVGYGMTEGDMTLQVNPKRW